MNAPFSVLHSTPSRLTSATSTSVTAATMDVSATTSEDTLDGSGECSSNSLHETERDDDYMNVDASGRLDGEGKCNNCSLYRIVMI